MVLIPRGVRGTRFAGGERMLDFWVHSNSVTTFIESLVAATTFIELLVSEAVPLHPHLGLRLRIRAEPRAEQLRCISQPRRFPHVSKKPPQRLRTKRPAQSVTISSALCSASVKQFGRRRSPVRRPMRVSHLCAAWRGLPALDSRRCWVLMREYLAMAVHSGLLRWRPSTAQGCNLRAHTVIVDEERVFAFIALQQVSPRQRMIEFAPFRILLCCGGTTMAQLLCRIQSLRRANLVARQLHASREALRQRISSLPRHLESDPSLEFEERPNWCDALHAADEIADNDLENLIARALAHAKQAFRGLAWELGRHVRAWIIANSTMGVGALHKWAARDDHAPSFAASGTGFDGTVPANYQGDA